MAFAFGNAGGPAFGSRMTLPSNGPQVRNGPDLEEIRTEAVSFLAFAAERKVRLLQTPWPSESLPPPTASLLSVASRRGLIAAAGPEGLVVASTESLRACFTGQVPESGDIIPFDPQLKLPMPIRISQVAFSADENYLVISAEQGGGLAVYDEQGLEQGNTTPAFQMSTNGVPLRALLPNPTPEKAELLAVVTMNGDLMMANLKTRQFISGPNGQVLRQQVSCVSWSTRGKQLVAGLGNGACSQMTPEGEGKAEIPRPPEMMDDQHVSSITWLENNVFLIAHTPTRFDSDSIPSSTFQVVTREPPSSYVFQKLPEPCLPFGLNRSPPQHFVSRLKDFPPSLQDMLIVASTGSTDVGLITRSKVALTNETPAEKITNVFTTAAVADDSRRAQLPMNEEATDTSPIGMVLDLSSKEKVPRPIPTEEIDESSTPLPALLLLNNEGILAAWWIVYADSIRQGTAYPGLVAVEGDAQRLTSPQPPPSMMGNAGQAKTGAFGSSFGSPQPSLNTSGPAPAFSTPAFGTPLAPQATAASTFGSSSMLGSRTSPWGTPSTAANAQPSAPAFGKPAFGSATPFGANAAQGSAFGSASALGARTSPWGTTSSAAPPNPGSAFGKPSDLGARDGFASAGGLASSLAPASGGFGSYANQGGFAAAAASVAKGPSFLGKENQPSVFGNSGGNLDTGVAPAAFKPSNGNEASGRTFGLGSSGFTLSPAFKRDGTPNEDSVKPATGTESAFFGSAFGSALDASRAASNTPTIPEAEMDTGLDNTAQKQASNESASATSSSPSASSNFNPSNPTQPGIAGTFGTQSQSDTTPAAVERSAPATLSFDKLLNVSSPEAKTEPGHVPGPSQAMSTPQNDQSNAPKDQGAEPAVDERTPRHTPSKETPDNEDVSTTSDSPGQVVAEEAPLPPDPLPKKSLPRREAEEDVLEEVALPGNDSDAEDDWEDSGEDVGQEQSPTTEPSQTIGLTPQSSFGGGHDRAAVGGPFTKVSRPDEAPRSRPLFGEIGGMSVPVLPPPARTQESPRSPSPVRSALPKNLSRPENARSISLPGGSSKPGLRAQAFPRPSQLRSEVGDKNPFADHGSKRQPADSISQPAQVEELDSSDSEDERVQAQLAAEVKPTSRLSPFVAHQDYVGTVKKPGIAGQIERLYRDINSMIDTLGLNAKTLQSFLKGHSELYKDDGRNLDDLEAEDDWCLIEVSELNRLESEVMEKLQEGKIQDVQGRSEECQDLQREVAKLRLKYNELKRIIKARTDPTQVAAVRPTPLSTEQAVQQREIRVALAEVQTLISKAEEGISLLRARVTSAHSKTGKAGSQATPTVEAVMNTIMKMTSMAEKRSGDVDVLENQLRKLNIDSDVSVISSSSFSSPPAPPPASKTPRTSTSTYGLFYTPDSSRRSTPTATPRASSGGRFDATTTSPASASRRLVVGAGAGAGAGGMDVEKLRAKHERKKEVGQKLRNALSKAGPRVKALDE